MVDNFFVGKFFNGGFFGTVETTTKQKLGIGWDSKPQQKLRKDDEMIVQLVIQCFVKIQGHGYAIRG